MPRTFELFGYKIQIACLYSALGYLESRRQVVTIEDPKRAHANFRIIPLIVSIIMLTCQLCQFIQLENIRIQQFRYKRIDRMGKKPFNYKIFRNLGIGLMILSPIAGYLYTQSKMKLMEKGIHDDLERIKSKGKTLADIPRKAG